MSVLADLIRELEIELHDPAVRCDESRLRQLLHARFVEIGQSGRMYSRSEVITALLREAGPKKIHSDNFHLEILNDGICLLRYRCRSKGGFGEHASSSLRSSIWVETDVGWQLRFHQGTTVDH